MKPLALANQQVFVDHLTGERVPKRVVVAARRLTHELLFDELADLGLEDSLVQATNGSQHIEREPVADHGSGGERLARLGRELVDARAHRLADRARDTELCDRLALPA